jgi:hypothetical protein
MIRQRIHARKPLKGASRLNCEPGKASSKSPASSALALAPYIVLRGRCHALSRPKASSLEATSVIVLIFPSWFTPTCCSYAAANAGHAHTGLAWTQINSAHRQVHRAFADPVQGFLALTSIQLGTIGARIWGNKTVSAWPPRSAHANPRPIPRCALARSLQCGFPKMSRLKLRGHAILGH